MKMALSVLPLASLGWASSKYGGWGWDSAFISHLDYQHSDELPNEGVKVGVKLSLFIPVRCFMTLREKALQKGKPGICFCARALHVKTGSCL